MANAGSTKRAPSWEELHSWLVDGMVSNAAAPARQQAAAGSPTLVGNPPPRLDYQVFLENASKTMIRFKKPEHLIKMIVRTIDEYLKVTHTAVFLHSDDRKSYVLVDSRGEDGIKIPVGLVRLVPENPIISAFNEKESYLISETGSLHYEEVSIGLTDRQTLELDPALYDKLLAIKRQMDQLRANLCVPCYFKQDLLGVLILGKKVSGERFTREETGFFVTLANNAAMAIANAQLIGNLQQKIDEVQQLYMREHTIFVHTAIALAAAIDARDTYTHGHTERVTTYAMAIASELEGLPEMAQYKTFQETLQIAALLHDVGKIGIPDHILNKSGRLTPEEFEEIKKHSVIGATILYPIKELTNVAKEIRYHQEKFDGSGYPDGLKGYNIPLVARIIAVADAFDAITSNRPYRKKRTIEEAIQEIKRNSGTQFDPVVVSAFLLAFEKGKVIAKRDFLRNDGFVS